MEDIWIRSKKRKEKRKEKDATLFGRCWAIRSKTTTWLGRAPTGPCPPDSGFGFRVSCFVFRVSCFVFRASFFVFRFSGFGFRVWFFGFRVSGLVFRVWSQLEVWACTQRQHSGRNGALTARWSTRVSSPLNYRVLRDQIFTTFGSKVNCETFDERAALHRVVRHLESGLGRAHSYLRLTDSCITQL